MVVVRLKNLQLKKETLYSLKTSQTLTGTSNKSKRTVGIMKSGYYYATVTLREKVNFPSWVKHSEGQSEQIAVDNSNKPLLPAVTVGNKIGNVTKEVSTSTVNFVLRRRAEAMRTQMVHRLNKTKTSLWDATMSGKISGTAKYFS
jgi:hypothetical protein